jgi:hypothetical protein
MFLIVKTQRKMTETNLNVAETMLHTGETLISCSVKPLEKFNAGKSHDPRVIIDSIA